MSRKTKEQELRQLEEFISCPRIFGTWVCQTLIFLSNGYPLQFIHFYKQYRNIKTEGSQRDIVDRRYEGVICELNTMYGKLQAYILNAPVGEHQEHEYEKIVEKLEPLLLRQMKKN